MNVKQMGETGILEWIGKVCGGQKDPRLLMGPGDDCAILKIAPGRNLVVTEDDMVENTHFIKPEKNAARIARKLLRINLSDLASMGDVEPLSVICGAAFPRTISFSFIREFTAALLDECGKFGVSLAGGNLARAADVHVHITAMGVSSGKGIVSRSSARPGDLIFGLGAIGESRAGLELHDRPRVPSLYAGLVKSFWLPEPRLSDGRIIGRKKLASAMMDNSDGLFKSVQTIARASGCGAVIAFDESVCSPALAAYCAAKRADWREYVLSGGEDYGLVLTVAPGRAAAFARQFPKAYRLGVMTEGREVKLHDNIRKNIFEHF